MEHNLDTILINISKNLNISISNTYESILNILNNKNVEDNLVDFLGYEHMDEIFYIAEHKEEVKKYLSDTIRKSKQFINVEEIHEKLLGQNNNSENTTNTDNCAQENKNEFFWEHKIPPVKSRNNLDVKMLIETKKIKIAFRGVELSQNLFQYSHFNAVQSKSFTTAYESNENYLLSAPTGSGKTDVALMSVLKVLNGSFCCFDDNSDKNTTSNKNTQAEKLPFSNNTKKVVYIVPMKALATEVVNKYKKIYKNILVKYFRKINMDLSENDLKNFCDLLVCEYTGDTDIKYDILNKADIIICTPEKYDYVSRKHNNVINNIELLIIDEIHLLDSLRGPILECIVARVDSIQIKTQSMIRVIGLSATVPNYLVIAEFINGKSLHFGMEYRPIELESTIVGFNKKMKNEDESKKIKMRIEEILEEENSSESENNYTYINIEEQKMKYLTEKIQEHKDKQILIFTTSRGSTTKIMRELVKANENIEEYVSKKENKQFKKSKENSGALKDTLKISIHHAGLSRSTRLNTEQAYKDKTIDILVSTTTLAWGVNLPADVVFIYNTEYYDQMVGGYKHMGILDIYQIQGRAGRIILEEKDNKQHKNTAISQPRTHNGLSYTYLMSDSDTSQSYVTLLSQKYSISSKLHTRISECILSEIYLRNCSNITEIERWYSRTFSFYVKNNNINIEDTITHMIETNLLDVSLLNNNYNLQPNNISMYASLYYVDISTFSLFADEYSNITNPYDLLALLCSSKMFNNVLLRQFEDSEIINLINILLNKYKDNFVMNYLDIKNIDQIDNVTKCLVLLVFSKYSNSSIISYSLYMDMIYLVENGRRIIQLIGKILLEKKEYAKYKIYEKVYEEICVEKKNIPKNVPKNILLTLINNKYAIIENTQKLQNIEISYKHEIFYISDIFEYYYVFSITNVDVNELVIKSNNKKLSYNINHTKLITSNLNIVHVNNIYYNERIRLINYYIVDILNLIENTEEIVIFTQSSDINNTIRMMNILYSHRMIFDHKNVCGVEKYECFKDRKIQIYKGITISNAKLSNNSIKYIIDTENNTQVYY